MTPPTDRHRPGYRIAVDIGGTYVDTEFSAIPHSTPCFASESNRLTITV